MVKVTEDYDRLLAAASAVNRNRSALIEATNRMYIRFGLQTLVAGDGNPHAVWHPAIVGTHPPYWVIFEYDRRHPHVHNVPQSTLNEIRALISQGIRLRRELEGLYPDVPRSFVFPLNLVEA